MDKDKLVVGLDIGTTKIVAIAGRKNEFGKLEILGMGKAVSEGVTRGVVTNIDRTVEAIQKAIFEAEEQAGSNHGDITTFHEFQGIGDQKSAFPDEVENQE